MRRKIPIKISTGTSALILHATILAALATNVAILKRAAGFFHAEQIGIPWRAAAIIAPVVVVGGQVGAFINSRLTDQAILKGLIAVYLSVGSFVLLQVLRRG